MRIRRGPPAGQIEQIGLKFVNTSRATIAGFEFLGEVDLSPTITPFAILTYTEGRDHTRDGRFATRPAGPGSPSRQDPGLSRGFYSGIPGSDAEPLPGIYPLESRTGFRLHQSCPRPEWSVELSARIVNRRNRVASSLLESASPGFTVWDLRGYWHPREGLTLVAGVENLTDRFYREHLDFRSPSGSSVFQPGVNFYAGSELRYQEFVSVAWALLETEQTVGCELPPCCKPIQCSRHSSCTQRTFSGGVS